MRISLLYLLACCLLAGSLAGRGWAGVETLWQYDYASAKLGPQPGGGQVVADALAPGGQALRIAGADGAAPGALAADPAAKNLVLAGTGTVRVWVRGKDLNDIANGLRIGVWLQNQTTNRMYGYYDVAGVVCGVRAGEGSYRALPIPFELPDEPGPYTLHVTSSWQKQTGSHPPVVWVSKLDLTAHGAGSPYISGLLRNRFTAAPGSQVHLTVTVVNPTQQAFQGKLQTEDLFGLAGRRVVLTTPVSLAPGERRVLDLAWQAAAPEGGHEFAFVLLDQQARELDRDRIGLGLAKDTRTLSFPTSDLGAGKGSSAPSSYVYPSSYSQTRNLFAQALADRNNRSARAEYFGWSWGDVGGFVAPDDPYIILWGGYWVSTRQYQQEIALANAAGIHCDTYILGCPAGEAAYQLYHRHPDWFIYGHEGTALGYNMQAHATITHGHDFEVVLSNDSSAGGAFDPTNPQVQRFVADQIIHTARVMGFGGCRWDVAYMNSTPRSYRMDGTEIAHTQEQADRLSAESLKTVKAMVAEALPDYTWGYNAGSQEEGKDNTLRDAEMCQGHGWMLDEIAYGYNAKTSPFHTWAAYSERMVAWGDHIRQLGGIYDPYPFDRGYNPATQSEMDFLYGTIFRLLAGGRSEIPFYKNNAALAGDLPLLAFRYNDLYSGWNLQIQPESQTRLAVEAPATLWWKGYVFTNRSPDGTEQLLVHLLNSPAVEEISENPESKVRPPVLGVKVTCAARAGRLPQRAWLVTAEPVTPDGEPRVQALPLKLTRAAEAASVTVPAVLYLKTVVFEY